MNLLINSKEDINEQRLYQTSENGIVCGTTFKIKDIHFRNFYIGHLFLTAGHCVKEYDEKMFYNPFFFQENTGEQLPLTIFSNIDKKTFSAAYPDLIEKHPKLDIAAIIIAERNWSYLGNSGKVRYKNYNINKFNLSNPPEYLKVSVFRNEYRKKSASMYFCKDNAKKFKIHQIDEGRNIIHLNNNILGGWSGSPALDPYRKEVVGIASKGFEGIHGNGSIVYFNKQLNKWIKEVENKLQFCFTGIILNGIPAIIHNRQIKVERNPTTNEIINVNINI